MDNTTKQRRSSIKIMGKMIGLVKPLVHIMTAAVLLGTLGYLCAIFLTITAGHGALLAMKGQRVMDSSHRARGRRPHGEEERLAQGLKTSQNVARPLLHSA